MGEARRRAQHFDHKVTVRDYPGASAMFAARDEFAAQLVAGIDPHIPPAGCPGVEGEIHRAALIHSSALVTGFMLLLQGLHKSSGPVQAQAVTHALQAIRRDIFEGGLPAFDSQGGKFDG